MRKITEQFAQDAISLISLDLLLSSQAREKEALGAMDEYKVTCIAFLCIQLSILLIAHLCQVVYTLE